VSPQKNRTRRDKARRCIVIAGPNGAGKTTFAQEFLPKYAKIVHFVNADLIAGVFREVGTILSDSIGRLRISGWFTIILGRDPYWLIANHEENQTITRGPAIR